MSLMNEWRFPARSRYEEMAGMADAEVIVLGDSHSLFFADDTGRTPNQVFPDMFAPQLRVHWLGACAALSLSQEQTTFRAREQAFEIFQGASDFAYRGWLLLSFGFIDLCYKIFDSAVTLGIQAACRSAVDEYVEFIDQARSIYPKIAVWAPHGTMPQTLANMQMAHCPSIAAYGNEQDRVYATMIFTTLLEREMQRRAIPLLCLFDTLASGDGAASGEYYSDEYHLHPRMLGIALDVLEARLGVQIRREKQHASFGLHESLRQYAADLQAFEDDAWHTIEFSSMRYLEGVAFLAHEPLLLPKLEIALGDVGSSKNTQAFLNIALTSTREAYRPVRSWARRIMVRAPGTKLSLQRLRVVERAGYFSSVFRQDNRLLHAMTETARQCAGS